MSACRICLEDGNLISVCGCEGTMKWVHFKCIQEWIHISKKKECEVCLAPYVYKGLKFYKPLQRKLYDRLVFASFPLGIMSGLFLWLDRIDAAFSMEYLFWYYIGITLLYNLLNYVLMFLAYKLGNSPIPLGILYYLGFVCGCFPGHMGHYLNEISALFYGINLVSVFLGILVSVLCCKPAH